MTRKNGCVKLKDAHFSKNTHLQLVFAAIAPPTNGPVKLAMAKTDEMMATYLPYSVTGTIVGARARTME